MELTSGTPWRRDLRLGTPGRQVHLGQARVSAGRRRVCALGPSGERKVCQAPTDAAQVRLIVTVPRLEGPDRQQRLQLRCRRVEPRALGGVEGMARNRVFSWLALGDGGLGKGVPASCNPQADGAMRWQEDRGVAATRPQLAFDDYLGPALERALRARLFAESSEAVAVAAAVALQMVRRTAAATSWWRTLAG